MGWDSVYQVGFWITWVVTFLIVWGCCASEGIVGFCLGWMPAIIIAYIAAYLWPLIAVGVFIVAMKTF